MTALRLPFVAVLVALATACSPPKPAQNPMRPQSEWVGEDAQLFDDGIDVGALPLNDSPPARDDVNEALITKRMDRGDAVIVGKVIAVSTEPVGDKRRYRLELQPVETLFRKAPEGTIALKVEPDSPAFGTVRAGDTKIIGKKLVVYFKQYAAEDGGDTITHFHLSATTKPVLEAIATHATRSEFK